MEEKEKKKKRKKKRYYYYTKMTEDRIPKKIVKNIPNIERDEQMYLMYKKRYNSCSKIGKKFNLSKSQVYMAVKNYCAEKGLRMPTTKHFGGTVPLDPRDKKNIPQGKKYQGKILMSANYVTRMLGIHEATLGIHRRTRARSIPYYKFPGSYSYYDLDKWLKDSFVPATYINKDLHRKKKSLWQ